MSRFGWAWGKGGGGGGGGEGGVRKEAGLRSKWFRFDFDSRHGGLAICKGVRDGGAETLDKDETESYAGRKFPSLLLERLCSLKLAVLEWIGCGMEKEAGMDGERTLAVLNEG